eukprot:TRINITY_DN2122_c0_g1_i1.p5 TRINITY_DN2122_c0_g1~~TRINITY_DN2122_c0_g1_i1.p5  ORF type:complete len:55 (-),score=4.49 TRINITY_DN2122_c0_g1_i1:742-906(-)
MNVAIECYSYRVENSCLFARLDRPKDVEIHGGEATVTFPQMELWLQAIHTLQVV